jgi:uncharacterized protein (TIGR00299 family) protein
VSYIAYLDCFSGISGDMLLGALIDAGAPPEEITKALPFPTEIKPTKVNRAGIIATRVEIMARDEKTHSFKDFKDIIESSNLSPGSKETAIHIIHDLFEVETRIHGTSMDHAHLHELGSIDTIIDIIGALKGFEYLDIKEVYCSFINTGRGSVKTGHGILPVPAPATVELLKDFIIYSSGPQEELTTPTGAAILKAIAKPSEIPAIRLKKIGYGAGSKDFKDWPNILRLFIGVNLKGEPEGLICEKDVYLIETNIDDMNPQIYEHLIELLLDCGALDVYIENIVMKKSRPGHKLSVLCKEKELKDIANLILKETTTIGIRFQKIERLILPRIIEEFPSSLGEVRLKIAEFQGIKKMSLEYEDIKKIAKKTGLPISEVIERIKKEISNRNG